MTPTTRSGIPDKKTWKSSNIFGIDSDLIRLAVFWALVILAILWVVSAFGCAGLGGFLADVGTVAGGGDLGGPGADTATEQIVEGVRTGASLIPLPGASEAVAAILSALAVWSYAKRRGQNAQDSQ